MLRNRILLSTIAGTMGGFIGWFLQENLINYNSLVVPSALPGHPPIEAPMALSLTLTVILCVGGMTGLFLGGVDGMLEGSRWKTLLGMLLGGLGGFLVGAIGFQIGGFLFNLLGGKDGVPTDIPLAFVQQVLARAFGWAPLGLGIGLGASLHTRSSSRIRQGAIGGLIGGFIGGLIFDVASTLTLPVQTAFKSGASDVGGPGRAIGFTAIGLFTGFLIGLVQELYKQSWVRVLAGRNEGRDILLNNPVNVLGRNELCSVPLFGDSSILPQHAAIIEEGNIRSLQDAGTSNPPVLNGQMLASGGKVALRDGDMIQIGMHRIEFHEKASANRYAPVNRDMPRSSPLTAAVPMPSHLCPYCVATKDASGNCLCTVQTSNASLPPTSYNPAASGVSSMPVSMMAAPVGMAQGKLDVVQGAMAGSMYMVDPNGVTIGRENGCTIQITSDATVSRQHAKVVAMGSQYQLIDNNSANGTYLNGVRTQTQILQPGDTIQIGTTTLRFE